MRNSLKPFQEGDKIFIVLFIIKDLLPVDSSQDDMINTGFT